MSKEQPAPQDSVTQSPEGGIRAAAQALAQKRWAHRQESQPVEAKETNPAEVLDTPDAPEAEHPAVEEGADSELQEGHDEGEEGEEPNEDGQLEESGEEDSEAEEPEEQPTKLSLDDLPDDATIVIDGDEITAQELREQRLMQADYTRKTQALQAQRETLSQREKLSAAFLGQQQAEITNRINSLTNLNWDELAKNPNEFNQRRSELLAAQMSAQQLSEKQRQFLTQIQRFEEEATKVQAQAAQKELKQRVPGWNNGLYYSLVDYAQKVGFNREEVLKYTDPNVFVLLQKARLYDEAQKVTTKKTVKSSPKRTPRAAQPTPPSRKQAQKQVDVLEQARKSGRIEDAVAALKAKRKLAGG